MVENQSNDMHSTQNMVTEDKDKKMMYTLPHSNDIILGEYRKDMYHTN
jgi:hypothetical protein